VDWNNGVDVESIGPRSDQMELWWDLIAPPLPPLPPLPCPLRADGYVIEMDSADGLMAELMAHV